MTHNLKLGDIVSVAMLDGKRITNCEVIGFCNTNNVVLLLRPNGIVKQEFAVWCTKQGFNTREHPSINRTGIHITTGVKALLKWDGDEGFILAEFDSVWVRYEIKDWQIHPLNFLDSLFLFK